MERGYLDLDGPFDLQATLESGQSYLWWRADGNDFDGTFGDDGWYVTTARMDETPVALRVRQQNEVLEWESTRDVTPVLRRRLRLDDDLVTIREAAPDDDVVERAFETYWGMRLVREPAFPTLVSFICSTQMRVARIHGMQQALREQFGTPVSLGGEEYRAYPTAAQLAATDESALRQLSLGYRAPYVQETASMVASEQRPEAVRGDAYEDARESLTKYVGVGQKVADCILLFALDYLEAVPLDTWIRKTISEYYPDCEHGSYRQTSQAIRDRLGGEYAGYTQTYLFHYLRHQEPALAAD